MIIQATENEFNLCDSNGIYAKVRIDLVPPWASFHTEITRWNHNIVKELKKDWIELKMFCHKKGIKELIASNADINDKRWPKFIKLFGFPYPTLVSISKQEL